MKVVSERSWTFLALFGLVLITLGAGSGSKSEESAGSDASAYEKGLELVESKDFAAARSAFEEAVEAAPEDADALNMLAFTQRKTGDLALAFETYARALNVRETFPQAREYLGEAHIAAVMQEILTLKGYGPEAEAHVAALVDALVSAAERAKTLRPAGDAAPKW